MGKVEEVDSPMNGKLVVMRNFAWGTYIQINKLTQSGGVVKAVWKTTLKKISHQAINHCLILGLGGGSAAQLVRKNWPEAKIVGVEIDPLMIELGAKYLELGTSAVDIKIEDAFRFVKKESKQSLPLRGGKYDLILVDTYVGDEFPRKFESEEFLKLVKKLLSQRGIVIFNRLYYGEKRKEAVKMLKKLEKVFPGVEAVYPEANVMFVCSLVE